MGFDQNRLMRLLPRRLLAGSAFTVVPSGLGTLLTLLAIPLLTRSYSVDEMGIAASVLSLALILAVILSFGVPQTLPSTSSATGAVAIVGAMMLMAALLAGLLAGAVHLLPRQWTESVFGDASSRIWWIAALAVAVTVNELMMYLAVRQNKYLPIGLSVLVLHALRAAVQLGAGWMGGGWEGLVCGDIVSRFFASAALMIGTWKSFVPAVRSAYIAELKRAGKEVAFGPRMIFPTTFLDMGVSQLPLLGISALYGASAAGYFSLVTKVVEGPTGLAARHIANVFHGELAERIRVGTGGIKSMVTSSFFLVFAVAGIPIVIAGLFGPTLFAVIFGEEWRIAGLGFSAFTIPCILITATSAPTRVLVVTQQVWRKLYVFAVFAAGFVLALGFAWLFEQPYYIAWIGLSLASTIGYLVYFSAALTAAAGADRRMAAL